MSSNSTTISDEDGDYEDWIEVFYSGDEPLNLQGLGLSDDYNQPFRWVFPDTTIYPGEYMLLWASNKDRAVPGSELHTNFAISASGKEVILTHPDGTRMDELPPTEIPTDISIGRHPDVTIYYTLDGTNPSETSNIYNDSLFISDRSTEPNSHSNIPTNFISSGTTGEYFSQIPVTLNPHSKPGYHFFHWEIDGEDPVYEQEYTRTFEQSTTVKAVFTSQFADAPRHNLSDGYYHFTEWYNEKPKGSYPEAMLFVYMAETEPGLDAIVAGITSGRYDLDSRTRINSLGEEGFAFINTSNLEGNPGYPGQRLGGALLTLDTQNEENIQVSW